MKKILIVCFILFMCFVCQEVSAQWYLDIATPEEAAVRDKPYHCLQNEIQKKLCDQNWGIDKSSFKLLTDHPEWQKIVRGGGIHRFDLTGGGDDCIIQLEENSPLYRKNLDARTSNSNKELSMMQWNMEQQRIIMQAKDPLGAADNFKKTHQKSLDSLKILNAQLKKSDKRLSNDKVYADILLTLNDDRIQGKELQDFRTYKVEELHNIPGVQQAFLYEELPDEDDPDTAYRAALYIGNFPKYTGKMEGVTFKSSTKAPWTDKQHSGKPIIENISVWIRAYHYEHIIKIIHQIDWTGLKVMIG